MVILYDGKRRACSGVASLCRDEEMCLQKKVPDLFSFSASSYFFDPGIIVDYSPNNRDFKKKCTVPLIFRLCKLNKAG